MTIIPETPDARQSAPAVRCRVDGCRHRTHGGALAAETVHEGLHRYRDGLFYVSAHLDPVRDESGREMPAAGFWHVAVSLTAGATTELTEQEAGALSRALGAVASWCRIKNNERHPAPAASASTEEAGHAA